MCCSSYWNLNKLSTFSLEQILCNTQQVYFASLGIAIVDKSNQLFYIIIELKTSVAGLIQFSKQSTCISIAGTMNVLSSRNAA